MKQCFLYFASLIMVIVSCNDNNGNAVNNNNNKSTDMTDSTGNKTGYSEVNGIKIYYETYGQGEPLVLIHGGGSTIQSNFGRIIPHLASHFKLIAVELQNHGRSGFRTAPQTFEQDADDVAGLLKNLGIGKASFFGFSNGGTTAMQIAIRHPSIVNNLILAAAVYKRNGLMPGFFDAMQQATLANMPQELKTAFLEVNPDTAKLQLMFEKDRDRMRAFKDISDEQVRSIAVPTLVITGDMDVVTTEHAVEMQRMIPHCRLAIIPGTHGECIGEITTLTKGSRDTEFVVTIIREFLTAPGQVK